MVKASDLLKRERMRGHDGVMKMGRAVEGMRGDGDDGMRRIGQSVLVILTWRKS